MSRETKQHVIVAAAALAFCLLLSAMAGPIDKGAVLDYQEIKAEARVRSLKSLADNTFTVEGVPGYFTDLKVWKTTGEKGK